MVGRFEASLKELPKALERCREDCFGAMRLGRRMDFAQVRSSWRGWMQVFGDTYTCMYTVYLGVVHVSVSPSINLLHMHTYIHTEAERLFF